MKNIFPHVAMFIALSGCCAHVITPEEMTNTAIGETFYRVHLFGKKYHKVPHSFDELPIREGYANRITDGWGRRLILNIKDDKLMTITSYGKDGKPGGEGENSDISRSHWLIKKDGSFWIDDDMWIMESKAGNRL